MWRYLSPLRGHEKRFGGGCLKLCFRAPVRASAPIRPCRLASFSPTTADGLVAALIGDSVVASNIKLDCPAVSYGLVSYGGDGHAFEGLISGTQVRRKRDPGSCALSWFSG